ncbi:cytochrome d ubiquinol oxidase subunit II [Planosporangium thailandense]|uniref:Cytochrome d ubiquinol oxidase subunit II n=1 Tax=Planosporangium thailandense TaxID=765197 RepID=A0ABX0XSW5_9ACTN|nr:cytochrome d ubiquinol oxidase subunit II [Planosporangium thailandense]NJC68442.1 cytochrome d ubiquinol oxidase subunit II [Planosporangium thailandense]
MAHFWYAILGLFLAAYVGLGGLDIGVGLVLPALRGDGQRRAALGATAPFFLGNQVWIVAAGGVLFAAFPRVEGELFTAAYPLVAALVLALVGLGAGVQLRWRTAAAKTGRGFDALITGSALVLAVGAGALLAALLTGLPLRTGGGHAPVSALIGGFPLAAGLAGGALALAHGAAYLSWRVSADPAVVDGASIAATARRIGAAAAPAAAALVAVAAWVAAADVRVRSAVAHPVAAVALAGAVAVAALLARLALRADRPALAVMATGVAVALPVVLVAAALFPHVLVSTADPAASRTVTDAAAGAPTLRLLAWLAGPVLPVLVALQVANWWLFRRRPDARCR